MPNAQNAAVEMVKVYESKEFGDTWTRSDWRNTAIRIETKHGAEAPTTVRGLNSNNQHHDDRYGDVPLMDLELVCSAQADKGNGPTPFDWTSNYTYYLFVNKGKKWDIPNLYIAVTHGCGTEWLVLCHMSNIRDEIAANIAAMPEPVRYMMLDAFMDTAQNCREKGAYDTRKEWSKAYYEGRIQKKRKNGNVYVSIESKWETERRLEKKAARAAKAA